MPNPTKSLNKVKNSIQLTRVVSLQNLKPKQKGLAKPTPIPIHNNSTNVQEKNDNFSCVMCNAKFATRNRLVDHFRQHGNNEIDIRGRPMLSSTLLKHPSTVSTVGELIVCEWCPEAFPNISKAIEHKFRKHRYESINYFCDLCGKLFPLKIALDQHKKVEHDNNSTSDGNKKVASSQNFVCQICFVSFKKLSALTFHEKCVHAVERRLTRPTICPPPSKKIKMNNSDEIISVYYCHLCGSEYMVKFNLCKHLETHHTEEQRNALPQDGIIVCKTCEAIFYSKKAYDTHNLHHKPDDFYVTSEEQRQKIVARVDQDFDSRRVPSNIEKYIPTERRGGKRIRNIPTATLSSPSTSKVDVGQVKKVVNDIKEESMSPASIASDSDDEC